jgi:peptide/nickel transport system permease protein
MAAAMTPRHQEGHEAVAATTRRRRGPLATAGIALILVLFAVAALAPLLANEAPLYTVEDGVLDLVALSALSAEDLAWLGALGALATWLVARRLRSRGFARRLAATAGGVLVLATFVVALRVEPRNLGVIPFRAREAAGVSMGWAPVPWSWRSIDVRPGARFAPPGRFADHPLGTDGHARDVAARLIYGTRVSLLVGVVAVAISSLIGIALGAIAGYFRGRTDRIVSWLIQVVMCFPVLFTLLAMQVFLPRGIIWIVLLLGLVRWTGVARLTRGEMMRLRHADFVLAARAQGVPTPRIIFRHLMPNALAPVLVSATFGIAGAILLESTLAFLGLGVPPPVASWGELLYQGRQARDAGLHLIVFPGLLIFATVLACNLIGEDLRDSLDPRLRREVR